MNKIIILYISLFLTVSPVYAGEITTDKPSLSGDETAASGKIDGMLAAEENYSGDRWMESGLASGFLLGLIGTGIVAGVSQAGTVDPPSEILLILQEKSDSYVSAYLLSYSKKAKKKRLKKSITGGLIGTVVIVAVLLNDK